MKKKCSKCKVPKALDQFSKRATSKDGLQSQCKACVNAYNCEYHVDNLDKEHARSRKYHVATRKRRQEYKRNWYANNRERQRESNHNWRVDNHEASNLIWHRRRALKKGCDVRVITVKDYRRIMSQPCYLCGIAPSTAEEHIIPLSRGGRHSIGNLLGACQPCNSRKKDRLLIEFRQYQRDCLEAA